MPALSTVEHNVIEEAVTALLAELEEEPGVELQGKSCTHTYSINYILLFGTTFIKNKIGLVKSREESSV